MENPGKDNVHWFLSGNGWGMDDGRNDWQPPDEGWELEDRPASRHKNIIKAQQANIMDEEVEIPN